MAELNTKTIQRGISIDELSKKAQGFGIDTTNLQKAELIRAIQRAEGFIDCFGKSNGQCGEVNCFFYYDCVQNAQTVAPVSEPTLKLSQKVPWSITIKEDWLKDNIIIVPAGLSKYMEGKNTLHLLYDNCEEILPYERDRRIIEGLEKFFLAKSLAEYDTVYLQLKALEPVQTFAITNWRKPFEELLQTGLDNLNWHKTSLRDCIIITLASFGEPTHYQKICRAISIYKGVSLGSVNRTLTRYSPAVFMDTGDGKWWLSKFPCSVTSSNIQ